MIAYLKKSFARRLTLYLAIALSACFALATFIVVEMSVDATKRGSYENAYSQLDLLTMRIEAVLREVSLSIDEWGDNIEVELQKPEPSLENLTQLTERLVAIKKNIITSQISLEPFVLHGKERFALNSSKLANGKIETKEIDNPQYDYARRGWYLIPKLKNAPYWSTPYIDEAATFECICSYCVPLKDAQGKFIGVYGADIRLEWLNRQLNSIRPFPNSYNFVIAHNGIYIVHPKTERVMRETILSQGFDSKNQIYSRISKSMVEGRRGHAELIHEGVPVTIFFAPVKSAGWSVAIVCPHSDIFAGTDALREMLISILSISLILVCLFVYCIVRRMTRPLKAFSESAKSIANGDFLAALPEIRSKDEMGVLHDSFLNMQHSLVDYVECLKTMTATQERIESELNIAREIQMSMIPKSFPPYPNRKDIDLCALLRPAREVGGDLYDFFLKNNHFYFCIGDVSGKGVPAALFMAVTRSTFRSVAGTLDNPAKIINAMNKIICSGNETNMFVTLFVGIVDLETGKMFCANAGHNPPAIVNVRGAKYLDLKSINGVPVGVFESFNYSAGEVQLKSGDALVLYTDGVTEAENAQHELYGDERLQKILARNNDSRLSAQTLMNCVVEDVAQHVQNAEQSDDLTLMAMRFKFKYSVDYRKIELRAEVGEISRLTAWVERICEEYCVAPDLAMNLNLALEEAVSNVINYAFPSQSRSRRFVVDFDKTSDGNTVWRIIDDGVAFDPTTRGNVDISLDADAREIGGLGIFMVKKIMDSVSYERKDGENILTMTKSIKIAGTL